MALAPGTLIARKYQIARALGQGGMGAVYAALNLRTGRRVAIKLLIPEAQRREAAVERFRREAQAAGVITSEHVTQVFDVEEDPQHGVAIVLELLEGESFLDLLRREGPLSLERLHPIVEQTLLGLVDAHAAGIIHRDLKPSNVFLETKDGRTRVKLLDFGISKLPKEMVAQTLTEAGQSLGTFSYMPPEQMLRAKSVDARADVYALGTVLFQALTAKLPYRAGNAALLVQAKTQQDAPSLAEATGSAWDPGLEAFVARALARDPEARFPSASEALSAWRALLPVDRPPAAEARRPGRAPVPSTDEEESVATRILDRPSGRGGAPDDVEAELATRVLSRSAPYDAPPPTLDAEPLVPTVIMPQPTELMPAAEPPGLAAPTRERALLIGLVAMLVLTLGVVAALLIRFAL